MINTALGRAHRNDPVGKTTGGPAGNARLTAWLGLALLLLFLVESATLVSLSQLIDVHLVIGAVLVPLAVAKTATTGWRMIRYYTRNERYVAAGPPPLLLRLLGPFVVLGSLGVLGSGLALVAIGPRRTFAPLVSVAGFSISPLTVHQVSFVFWLATVGLHVLARSVPAVRLALDRRFAGVGVPGRALRAISVTLMAALAATAGILLLHFDGGWSHANGPSGHASSHQATAR